MTAITTYHPQEHDLDTITPDLLAGQVSSKTLAKYRSYMDEYLDFCADHGKGRQEALTNGHMLARWRNAMVRETDRSPNTINTRLSSVRSVLQQAAEQGYVARETAESFSIPGVSLKANRTRLKANARVAITPEQVRAMCELPDRNTLRGLRDRALLHTLASTGIRVSELVSLTTAQIQPNGRGVFLWVQGKNDIEPRKVALSTEAYKAILAWLDARGFVGLHVFTSFVGKSDNITTPEPMTAMSAWRAVTGYAKQAGIAGLKPHDLRRFVGTQFAERYGVKAAQKQLGHADPATTLRHYVLSEVDVVMANGLY